MWLPNARYLFVGGWPAVVVAILSVFTAAQSSPFVGQARAQAPRPAAATAAASDSNRQPAAALAAPKKKGRGCREVPRPKTDHGFTPEREAAALTFVTQYHPELAKLLATLKTKEKEEYCRAIRDLFRHSERLAVYQEKFPERYDLELKAWQIKSRIQLVAARLRLSPGNACLRAELKQALVDQADVRIALLRQEREKTNERLQRLDDQIDEMQKQREQAADKQLQALLRTVAVKSHPKQESPAVSKKTENRTAKDPGKDSDRPKATNPTAPTKHADRESP